MGHPSQQQRPPRSALLEATGAAVSVWGAAKLFELNQSGVELAGFGAIIVGCFGFRFLGRLVWAMEMGRRIRHAERAAKKTSTTHGQARWGRKKDFKKAGMFKSGGFFIGAHEGKDIYYHGDGSAFIFAPPGTGKTTSSVIPQLLMSHTDSRGRPVSLCVLDLKGELYCVCAKRMRELGYEVIAIAPWAKKMSEELGLEIEDHGCNIILLMLSAGQDTKDLAEQLSELMLPGSANSNASSDYFLKSGRDILTWGLLVLADIGDPAKMNMVELRKLLMSPPEDLELLLAESSQNAAFGGALQQQANKLIQTQLNAPEEWSGVINTATQALRIYDDFGVLGKHVSAADGFDFARIKDKPTCVFIIIPSERVSTHGAWLNTLLSVAIERIGSDRTSKRVLFLFDEFANAGYLPGILRALGLYRSQGFQCAFYTQTASQIRRLYGEDGLRDFLGMCSVIQAFGVRDPETLRMLSELAGQDTVKEFSQNIQPEMGHATDRFGYSTSAANQGKALIRPEDIRTLPDNKQLVFIENKPPILMDKVSYLSRRLWRRWAQPNPYHRK